MANHGTNDSSRQALLEAAFHEFWTRGYNGTRVDEIVEQTAFTKGAFYHHFPSKKALVCAVIREIIGAMLDERWLRPLRDAPNPVAAIAQCLDAVRCDGPEGVRNGCPLNNLAQELSGSDDEIRLLAQEYFEKWINGFTEAIKESQTHGQIRPDVDPRLLATTIVAGYEGGVSLAKAARSAMPLNTVLDGLIRQLNELRIT
ncbi:MAG: TetR family transcriptional regulator [Candidatus Hydrogenedentota bacterium]